MTAASGEEECNQPNQLYESNAVIGLHFYRLCQDMRYLQTRVIMIPCVSIIRGTRADKGDASRVRASLAIEECPGTRIGLQGPRGGSLYN